MEASDESGWNIVSIVRFLRLDGPRMFVMDRGQEFGGLLNTAVVFYFLAEQGVR
jgi:hypothetical protein